MSDNDIKFSLWYVPDKFNHVTYMPVRIPDQRDTLNSPFFEIRRIF